MKTPLLLALGLVFLLLPIAWGVPLNARYGDALCVWESALFTVPLFGYYLAYGAGFAWVRARFYRRDESFLGILLYFNLPLTAVYFLRNVDWTAPLACTLW